MAKTTLELLVARSAEEIFVRDLLRERVAVEAEVLAVHQKVSKSSMSLMRMAD